MTTALSIFVFVASSELAAWPVHLVQPTPWSLRWVGLQLLEHPTEALLLPVAIALIWALCSFWRDLRDGVLPMAIATTVLVICEQLRQVLTSL